MEQATSCPAQQDAAAWDDEEADRTSKATAGGVPPRSPSSITQPAGGAAGGTRLSHHYDSSRDLVLRFEFVDAKSFKVVLFLVWVVILASLVALVVVLVVQVTGPANYFFTHNGYYITNITIGSLLTAATLATGAQLAWRVVRSSRSGKRWTHRRRRLVTQASVELGLQTLNSIFYLVPNSYVLAEECSWFHPLVTWSAYVRWTVWNCAFLLYWVEAASWRPAQPGTRWYVERREETGAPVVMDAPVWRHYRKAAAWLALQGLLSALCAIVSRDLDRLRNDVEQAGAACSDATFTCANPARITALAVSVVVVVAFYTAMYALSITRAFRHLQRLPYNEYKQANYVIRVQVRQRSYSLAVFFLSMITYTFVGLGTCRSYPLTWLGYVPSMLAMVCTSVSNGWAMTPSKPHDDHVLQVWLQEFCWTEGQEEQRKKAERASSLPPGSASAAAIDREPIFCMETAFKAMYWSFLVYDQDEIPASTYSMEHALQLYDLPHFEMHWDRDPSGLDTKAVVGWSNDRVVIAFRGTASLANVKADMQVWRTGWPPGAGQGLLCTAPMVHRGFHRAWTANGFRDRIMRCLQKHLLGNDPGSGPRKPVQVLVTGHSLGGALATLCAYDLAQQFSGYPLRIKCYTFGSPRVGNHAFVRLYDEAVPDTWHLINNADVVTRAGKFWVLYKRAGHRVLVNRLGDMVVRPSYQEVVIRKIPGAASVHDHLLTSYRTAMASVLGVQFSSKRFAHGAEGVLRLAQQTGGAIVLGAAGLAHDTLAMLQEQGWDALVELRRRARKGSGLLPPWALRRLRHAPADAEAKPEASGELEEGTLAKAAAGEPAKQLDGPSCVLDSGMMLEAAGLARSSAQAPRAQLQRLDTVRGPAAAAAAPDPLADAAELVELQSDQPLPFDPTVA